MTKITDISQDSGDDLEETRVKKFAKHMLKGTLFIGTFQEKRFVEPLNSYRDVIKVSEDETDLIENLLAVRKRCARFYTKDKWIGITEPKTIGAPAGHNLWVNLDEEVFGSYWYKIKTVEFLNNEVCVQLEVVRPVSREKTPVLNITSQQIMEELSQHNVSELKVKVWNYCKEVLSQLFTETLTFSNIKEAAIFIFLLLSTMVTFLIQAIKFLLDYILKLLREISGFIKVCTPIIVSFMQLVGNAVNGFYSLIAFIWKGSKPPVYQHVHRILPPDSPYNINTPMKALPYPYANYQRSIPRYQRSQVRIEPLD